MLSSPKPSRALASGSMVEAVALRTSSAQAFSADSRAIRDSRKEHRRSLSRRESGVPKIVPKLLSKSESCEAHSQRRMDLQPACRTAKRSRESTDPREWLFPGEK
jgi:hypothetical protein